jgi:hypothetical protein
MPFQVSLNFIPYSLALAVKFNYRSFAKNFPTLLAITLYLLLRQRLRYQMKQQTDIRQGTCPSGLWEVPAAHRPFFDAGDG